MPFWRNRVSASGSGGGDWGACGSGSCSPVRRLASFEWVWGLGSWSPETQAAFLLPQGRSAPLWLACGVVCISQSREVLGTHACPQALWVGCPGKRHPFLGAVCFRPRPVCPFTVCLCLTLSSGAPNLWSWVPDLGPPSFSCWDVYTDITEMCDLRSSVLLGAADGPVLPDLPLAPRGCYSGITLI